MANCVRCGIEKKNNIKTKTVTVKYYYVRLCVCVCACLSLRSGRVTVCVYDKRFCEILNFTLYAPNRCSTVCDRGRSDYSGTNLGREGARGVEYEWKRRREFRVAGPVGELVRLGGT